MTAEPKPQMALDVPLETIIARREDAGSIRQSVLTHEFFRQTTLRDVIDAPEQVLRNLGFVPQVGAKTASLLKLLVSEEIAKLHPDAWQAASAPGGGDASDRFVARLAKVRRVFGASQVMMRLDAEFREGPIPASALRVDPGSLRQRAGFLYLCNRIAELLDLVTHFAQLHEVSASASAGARWRTGCVLLDQDSLGALVARAKAADCASAEVARAQLLRLEALLAQEGAGVTAHVADFRAEGLVAAIVTSRDRICLPLFGGHIAMDNPAFARLLRQRAEAVCAANLTLGEFLRRPQDHRTLEDRLQHGASAQQPEVSDLGGVRSREALR